jgi:broad specificity phosphatase PhoE
VARVEKNTGQPPKFSQLWNIPGIRCVAVDQYLLAKMAESSDSLIAVMRHGPRLDEDPNASWGDKSTRPYDPPLADLTVPVEQIEMLRSFNITVVVSSPLRRCLQTAGIICRALRISSLVIDYGFSEVMHSVRSTGVSNVSFLSSEEILDVIGGSVEVADVRGVPPPFSEGIEDSLARFNTSIKRVVEDYSQSSILCVSHGNAVEVCGSHYVSPPVLAVEVNYHGFIAVRDHRVVASSGVSLVDEVDSL